MLRKILLISILFNFFSNAALFAEQPSTATVKKVTDGDTIVPTNGERVRYIGVNTPELSHPFKIMRHYGRKARAFNRSLVDGKDVRLELDLEERDRYGRLLAYVYVDDTFVNAELIKAGYGVTSIYFPNIKYCNMFLKLQQEASSKEKGLWGEDLFNPAKKPRAPEASIRYITLSGARYHRKDCRYLKGAETIFQIELQRAEEIGHKPCRTCKP